MKKLLVLTALSCFTLGYFVSSQHNAAFIEVGEYGVLSNVEVHNAAVRVTGDNFRIVDSIISRSKTILPSDAFIALPNSDKGAGLISGVSMVGNWDLLTDFKAAFVGHPASCIVEGQNETCRAQR